VLLWVSQGKSNEKIGTILSISHNTVKNHLKRIFKEMGVTARSQAVRLKMQDTARSR
jgi:DNA-binding CsgD family transcriptional regulator